MPSTPRLSEVARHLVLPEGIETSVWPRVERRLATVDVRFDLWQRGLASAALGCRADGLYAATIGGVVLSIPRQVGKTFTVGNMLLGLAAEFPGLRAIWTSHHSRTTTNTFRAMQGMVNRKRFLPLLAPNGIRRANGEQEILLRNGSLIMFGAREHGFGRGMDAIDIEVFDEAQILSLKALDDMVPATNQAKHPHGALLFFIGTPPKPEDDSEAFLAKRSDALDGETTDQMMVELSADPDADPDDRDQWRKANPSFPHRTPLESMLRMRRNMPDVASWCREALGIWDAAPKHMPVITSAEWKDLHGYGPPHEDRPDGLAIDMSHQREISISACWIGEDWAHGEEVWAGRDEDGAVQWVVKFAGRRTPILIDSMSPAASMIPALQRHGCRIESGTAQGMAKACGLTFGELRARRLTHGGQDRLNRAIAGARRRKIGQAGGWGWDRTDESVNVAPLVSFTLARYVAELHRKRKKAKGPRVVVL